MVKSTGSGSITNSNVSDTVTKILIVEDDEDLLEILHEMVEYLGHHAVAVTEAEEAIKLLEAEAYDIVISDIFLPGINGLELLEYINEHHSYTDVIITTGFTDKYSFPDIIRAGAIDFIPKPFDRATLEAKLIRAIRERTMIDALYRSKKMDKNLPLPPFWGNAGAFTSGAKEEPWPVELQKLHAKIEEVESRYRKFFETAGDFVFLTELSSGYARIVNLNNSCTEALGLSKPELIGKSIFDFFAKNEAENFDEAIFKISNSDLLSVVFETEIIGAGNSRIPLEINTVLIQFNDLPYALNIARDKTESKKAQKALAESEKRYRAIFDNSSLGLGISAISSPETPTNFIDCNARLAALAGISKEELISSVDLHDSIIVQDLPWQRFFNGEVDDEVNTSRYSWIRPDGIENHIVCESKAIQLDDQQYLLSFHRDVTAKVKADEKIKELSRQMGLAVEREKKRIALDIHDELGQQIHSMRYLADRMREDLNKVNKTQTSELPKMINELSSQVERLGETCRDITFQLSPARLECLDIRDIIGDLVEFVRETFPDKSIHAEISSNWEGIDSYSKMVVFRIMQEAINNIIEHSEANNIYISVTECPDSRILTIKDDGIGFDPNDITLQESGNSKMRGYGLIGMAERINSLNGEINFFKKDEGTLVEVKIPRDNG